MNPILTNYIENQVLLRPVNVFRDLKFNNVKFNYRSEFNTLVNYVDKFLEGNPINRYLVLPGLRGVGKTTLMFQVYEYLLVEKNIKPENMLYLSCDKLRKISDASILDVVTTYLEMFHNDILETVSEPVFLFIDEAQYDVDWSLIGKIIFDSSSNIFMIFSGSSALDFSYNADSARRLLRIPISTLSYSNHLKLKYGHFNNEISASIEDLIFTGEIGDDGELERKIRLMYSGFKNYDINEWENFLQFGGFPVSFYQDSTEISKKISDMVDKVISFDMKKIEGINDETLNLSFQLLNFFVLQDPGEVSKESLANLYNSNKTTIKKLLDIFEKTLLLFHVEPFTSSAKRTTKPNKYFFTTPSLKHNLALNLGYASRESRNAYMGKLLEHFVASSFFNLNYKRDIPYKVYYDAGKKGKSNVDFVIQRGLENPIPIEVSYGIKDKKQIKKGISKYNSPYGIVISNNLSNIQKDDNIIYLPPKIFALM